MHGLRDAWALAPIALLLLSGCADRGDGPEVAASEGSATLAALDHAMETWLADLRQPAFFIAQPMIPSDTYRRPYHLPAGYLSTTHEEEVRDYLRSKGLRECTVTPDSFCAAIDSLPAFDLLTLQAARRDGQGRMVVVVVRARMARRDFWAGGYTHVMAVDRGRWRVRSRELYLSEN